MKRKFAFDWGGCLENNESLRQIARDLFFAGYETYLVPACGQIPFPYELALQSIGVPCCGIRLVIHDAAHSPEMPGGSEWIANEKVRACKELGCSVLYDDNQFNLEAARKENIEAIFAHFSVKVPLPPELDKRDKDD